MEERNMKIRKNELFFLFPYLLLYLSFFLGDTYIRDDVMSLARYMRLVSYFLLVLCTLNMKFKIRKMWTFAAILSVTLIFAFITRDFYWSVIVILIFQAQDILPDNIIKISMRILLLSTLTVTAFCIMGILPDRMTSRDTINFISYTRHSFGFYHSNVLPLILLYLELYYIFIMGEKSNYGLLILFILTGLVINYLCDSRNAFYLCIFVNITVIILKLIKSENILRTCLHIIARLSVPFLFGFSYLMMVLLAHGGIWDRVDYIFSGRFRAGVLKMRDVGLHWINFMSNKEFFSDGIVCDNGYIYILMRYGILSILFYFLISEKIVSKYKRDKFVLVVITVMFFANFIDNDLVDYLVLPFILIAFNSSGRTVKNEKIKLIGRGRYGSGNGCNVYL